MALPRCFGDWVVVSNAGDDLIIEAPPELRFTLYRGRYLLLEAADMVMSERGFVHVPVDSSPAARVYRTDNIWDPIVVTVPRPSPLGQPAVDAYQLCSALDRWHDKQDRMME